MRHGATAWIARGTLASWCMLGPDGGYNNTWMAAIEAQIIEGGVGDILVLTGSDPVTGQVLPTLLTAEITKDRDGEKVWKRGGERLTLSAGRINWFGRDVDWADKVGFRGKDDVESPLASGRDWKSSPTEVTCSIR